MRQRVNRNSLWKGLILLHLMRWRGYSFVCLASLFTCDNTADYTVETFASKWEKKDLNMWRQKYGLVTTNHFCELTSWNALLLDMNILIILLILKLKKYQKIHNTQHSAYNESWYMLGWERSTGSMHSAWPGIRGIYQLAFVDCNDTISLQMHT